jgi:hypothetical protein
LTDIKRRAPCPIFRSVITTAKYSLATISGFDWRHRKN